MNVSEMRLAGRHNLANGLAALALGHAAGLAFEPMLSTLRSFRGLPHRCQQVAEIGGVRYVDDSKGTNVGATQAALVGLGDGENLVLLAGGQGKGADFSQLREPVSRHCKLLVLFGEDAGLLETSLEGCAPVIRADSLEGAVKIAVDQARRGDTVLLSPACASLDMFSSYVARGEAFQAAVQAIAGVAHD